MSAVETPAEPVVTPKRRSMAVPLVGLGALLALGAGGITLAARAPSMPQPEIVPAPVLSAEATPSDLLPVAPARPELMGPPRPELAGPPVPPAIMAKRTATRTTTVASNRGSIGYMGPIAGPLNANVSGQGPIWGPQWERKPLPSVLGGPILVQPAPAPVPSVRQVAAVPGSDISSELPDERTVALSRLANPQLQVRNTAAKADEVSAEKPLSLRVSLKDDDFRVGEAVTARVSASAACYAALVLVNSEGKALTIFQTPRPTREFSCLLKAGPSAGAEYLLAVASVHPLGGTDLASVLRGGGGGFTAVKAAEGSMPPATAWSHAVAQVDELDNGQRKLQRFEWATDTASFVTTAPVAPKPAVAKAGKEAPKAEETPKPDGSALPKPAGEPKLETKPEPKPAAPSGDDSVLPK